MQTCKFNSILVFITVLLGFTTPSLGQSRIDYASLPKIDLSIELTITDSENFIPANLNGFFLTENGDLLITDRSGPGIHQFTSEGEYITKVARDGRGPGELSPWFYSHFTGSTLIATNNPGYYSTMYQPDEEGIFRYVETVLYQHTGSFLGFRSENDLDSFYISENKDLQQLRTPPEFTNSNIHIIENVEDRVRKSDLILTLQIHSDFIEEFPEGAGIRVNELPYRYSDSFQSLSDGKFLVARPDSQRIRIYNQDLQEEYELNLNVVTRNISDEDFEYHFGHYSRANQRIIEELIHENKPAFMDVKLDDSDRFWLWTDNSTDGVEYVVLNYEGEPIGKVLLPSGQRIEMISGDRLYVISEPAGITPSAIVYNLNF